MKESHMTFPRLAVLAATLVALLTAWPLGPAEAQNNQTFRFEVSFTTDLNNYVQADEYLDLIKTMVGIPDGPFPEVCGTPLCDPGFVGFYQDLYVVGVIDGLEIALAHFMPGNVLRCGDLIASISDASANKMRAVDPRLRGSQGAALTVIQTALERGCTIAP
jgi:hypothetical protein